MLSATIDRFAHGSLNPKMTVAIESVDFKTSAEVSLDEEILYDGHLDLIKAAVKRFGRENTSGYDLVLRSNAPGSGLGVVDHDGRAHRLAREALRHRPQG